MASGPPCATSDPLPRTSLRSMPARALGEVVVDQPAPGLEAVVDAQDVARRDELAIELLGLADRHAPAGGFGREHDADMHGPDRIGVVVQETDEARLGRPGGLDLLGELAREARPDVAVARVEMPADPDRPALVETRVSPGTRATHEEEAPPIAQDEVWDDLLPGRIQLGLGSRAIGALGRDEIEVRADVAVEDAVPPVVPHQAGSWQAEHELGRCRGLGHAHTLQARVRVGLRGAAGGSHVKPEDGTDDDRATRVQSQPDGTSRPGRRGVVVALVVVLAAALIPTLSPAAAAQSPSPEASVPTESLPPPPSDAPGSTTSGWEYRTLFVRWDTQTLDWVADFSDDTHIQGLDAILNNEGKHGWELVAVVPELWQQIVENAIREDARRLRIFLKKPLD